MRRPAGTTRPLGLAAALLLSGVLASCGSSSSGGSSAGQAKTTKASAIDAALKLPPVTVVGLPQAPGGIVAHVGPYAITQTAYEHALAAEVDAEPPPTRVVPVPPHFAGCVAHMKAAAPATGASAAVASPATLEQECKKKYETLRETVLDRLITNQWLIGGASELGLKVGESEVQQNIAEFKRHNFPTEAKFNAYLKSSGQTLGDLIFQTRVEFLSQGIRNAIKRKVGSFPNSRISAYYEAHKHLYVVPETRDFEIARTKTRAEALEVKRELASGKSFASVVKTLPLKQPIFSKEGLVKRLKSGVYNEPPLNNAIFRARTGVLSRPVHIFLGWYVFEVKRIQSSRLKPLSEVAAHIKKTLPEQLQQKALVAYIKAWRRRWTVLTDCASGYVVRRCRQFKVTSSTPAEDAYTLN
jgi:PPIC-type PPIASE domain/SurA N-terminal domain